MFGVTASQIDRLEQREAGLKERAARLTVIAPFSGQIRNSEQLHDGRWVNPAMPLMTVVEGASLKLTGLSDENSLNLLEIGQTGTFIADRGDGPRLAARIIDIDISAAFSLPYPELGSAHGGHVAVRKVADTRLIPEGAHYPVAFSVDNSMSGKLPQREPGIITVEGKRRSWLWQQIRHGIAVLVREAGF